MHRKMVIAGIVSLLLLGILGLSLWVTQKEQEIRSKSSHIPTVLSSTSIDFFGNIGNSQTASPTRTPAAKPTPSPFVVPTFITTRTQYIEDTSNPQNIVSSEPSIPVDTVQPISLILTIVVIAGAVGLLFIIFKIRDAL